MISTILGSKVHFAIFSTSENDCHKGKTKQRSDLYIHKNATFLLEQIHWKKILYTNKIVCLFYASVKRKENSAIITCRIERISRTTHFQKHPVPVH